MSNRKKDKETLEKTIDLNKGGEESTQGSELFDTTSILEVVSSKDIKKEKKGVVVIKGKDKKKESPER